MSKRLKKSLIKILIAFIILLTTYLLKNKINYFLVVGIYLGIYFLFAYKIIKKAIQKIISLKTLDEQFLMSFATICAILIGKFEEACLVILLYQLGEIFQKLAVSKTRNEIKHLMDIVPKTMKRVNENQEIEEISISQLKVGDIVVAKIGDKIGIDGKIIKGSCSVDTSSFSGEFLPCFKQEEDEILASSIVVEGYVYIEVTKRYLDSLAYKIIELIEEANEHKTKSELFLTKFCRYYTPIVVGIGVFIFIGSFLFAIPIYRALNMTAVFFVLSCPCALLISIPITFISGLGLASKNHILIKGANFLEDIYHSKILCSDKTGTLTSGEFCIEKIEQHTNMEQQELYHYIYNMERYATHPIAKSICNYIQGENDDFLCSNIENKIGLGIEAIIKGNRYLIGNQKLMAENKIVVSGNSLKKIYMARDNKIIATITLSDYLKKNAEQFVAYCHKNQKEITIISGDQKENVEEIATKLSIKDYYFSKLPIQKLEIVKQKSKNQKTIYLGDGINDALVLQHANVGISIGKKCSEIVMENSDVVIYQDDLSTVSLLFEIAKKTMHSIYVNIGLILGTKFSVLVISLFMNVPLWLAILSDVGISLLVTLYGMRLLWQKNLLKNK